MNSFWKTISYIFHPVLMPTLGAAMVMASDPYIYLQIDSIEVWLVLLSVILISTAVMPLFLSWVMFKAQRISSITHPTEQDRKQLMIFTEICFLLAWFTIHKAGLSLRSLDEFILGINIAMIGALITSMFTGISLHSVGIGGLVGAVIGLMYTTRMEMFPLFGAITFIAVIIGVSRYKLKAHQPADLYIGYIVGIASQAAVFMLMGR